mmetsp:Transcript_6749/g.14800  ORF Transcript_6749/g.14800 Transcript_6749/m.14800 type:complete len:212 (-) Transcript_6749:808-1443(-)
MVSPMANTPGLWMPMTSPGKASVTDSLSCAKSAWAEARLIVFFMRLWETFMPLRYTPEHTRMKAMRSRCLGSRLACSLNTKPVNSSLSGFIVSSSGVVFFAPPPMLLGSRSAIRPGGVRAYSKKVLRNNSTPKLVIADPKKRGVCSPACTRAKSGSVMSESKTSISSSSCAYRRAPMTSSSTGSLRETTVASIFLRRSPRANRCTILEALS